MIKSLYEKIKQRIDWILIVLGVYMTIYGIFDIRSTSTDRFRGLNAWAYYYSSNTQIVIAIGVALLVFGILIYKEKRLK